MNSVSQKCVVEATTLSNMQFQAAQRILITQTVLFIYYTLGKKSALLTLHFFFQAKLYFMNSSNSNFDKGTMQIMLE